MQQLKHQIQRAENELDQVLVHVGKGGESAIILVFTTWVRCVTCTLGLLAW